MQFVVAFEVLAFLALSANGGASMYNPYYCYATDTIRSMTNMASTITSYEAIRRFNFATVNPYVSTCTPSKFWLLSRYAARLPHPLVLQRMIDLAESSIQDDIIKNYNAGKTTLCRQDYENIRNFTMGSEYVIENALLVTEAGRISLENIARRFQQVFPDILNETYTPTRFHFRDTGSDRTNVSIRAFATGLFGEAGSANVTYEPIPEFDWFLRPFDFCPYFRNETADSIRHREAFKVGPEFEEMIQQVNRKLGFHSSNQLNFDRVYDIWNWCRYPIAATFETSNSEIGGDSPWCAAFSVGHHFLWEYYQDLDFYYVYGYGVRNRRLLENMNCGLIQDLLRHMQSENDTDATARIFVTYTEEIQAMLVALGTFTDAWPIHEYNFAQQTGRKWLTSLIGSFGSNLAIVRFDCDDGDHDFIFLFNEKPILIPGCDQQNGVCKLSVIVNRFQRFVDANCSTFFCSSN